MRADGDTPMARYLQKETAREKLAEFARLVRGLDSADRREVTREAGQEVGALLRDKVDDNDGRNHPRPSGIGPKSVDVEPHHGNRQQDHHRMKNIRAKKLGDRLGDKAHDQRPRHQPGGGVCNSFENTVDQKGVPSSLVKLR